MQYKHKYHIPPLKPVLRTHHSVSQCTSKLGDIWPVWNIPKVACPVDVVYYCQSDSVLLPAEFQFIEYTQRQSEYGLTSDMLSFYASPE
jgi:hypothetical protein